VSWLSKRQVRVGTLAKATRLGINKMQDMKKKQNVSRKEKIKTNNL
jgi:hypothetical protein